jgi:FkbM family methyltransferase
VSFVQIGANDGVIDDPIFGLISDDWSGVFVEPNPVAFKKLQELYKDRPKFKFFNVAITLEGGEVEMNIPFDSTNLGSLNNEWDHLSHIGTPNVSKIKVPSLKLQELFQRIDAAEVNLLIVDTEGYDFKLVNELLDGTKVRPDVVQYEHVLMSEEQKSSLTRKFIGCGYATVVNDVDSIAVRVSPGFTRNP